MRPFPLIALTVPLTVAKGGKGLITSPRRRRAKLAQFKVKAGTATGLYNTDLVCIQSGDTHTSLGVNGGNSVVIKFSIDEKGKASSKSDMRSIGCGLSSSSTSFNTVTKCWIDDPSWDFPLQCSDAGGVWVAPNTPAGSEKYKPGDLVGLCQNFFMGFELEPPGSPAVLAETGTHSPCKKC